jgi:hypothetical protein
MQVLLRFTGSDGEIAIDPRHAPLYLSVWEGELDEEIVRDFFVWSKERSRMALEMGTHVAYVNDVDRIRVNADMRKLISDLSKDFQQSGYAAANVGSWQILSSPMIRGALTAVRWMTSDAVAGKPTKDWMHGIREALQSSQSESMMLSVNGEPV